MLLEMTRAAQTGLRKERQYELITNHLANANTPGYKREILSFDQMMKASLSTDFSDGDVRHTGNKLDLALRGDGFFKIQTPAGFGYTRNGNFTLNSEGVLVTQNGEPVLGDGGAITIQGQDVYINEAGGVFVDGAETGNVLVVNFQDKDSLEKKGKSLFAYTGNPLDEQAAENIRVVQGGLESANLSTVKEMTKMIETHRLYETAQKMMRTIDELDGKATTMGASS